MLLGGLVAFGAASLAARQVGACEQLFGFHQRGTGAFSIPCTGPMVLMGLAFALALFGSLHLPFGIALWNHNRQSRSGHGDPR